jgi:hypothetical protein
MSAYVVDREHIRYLINAAMRLTRHGSTFTWLWDFGCVGGYKTGELRFGDHERAAEVGQMLWATCIRGVANRYPDDTVPQLPGPVYESYVYDRHYLDHGGRLDPVQALKACKCFVYQACESPDYSDSEAASFIESLMATAINRLDGYEEAEWGAPRPTMPDPTEAARVARCRDTNKGVM